MRRSLLPTAYDATPENNPPLDVHQQIARIQGLKTDQTYFYRAVTRTGSRFQIGNGYFFKTAPNRGKEVKFALLSDLQLKPDILSTVKMVGQSQPDFIIYNGDLRTPLEIE